MPAALSLPDLLRLLAPTGARVANAEALGVTPEGVRVGDAESIRVERPAALGQSRSGDIAFFFSKSYQHELPGASPSILVTGEDFATPLAAAGLPLWKKSAVVACKDPYLAMAILSERFAAAASTVFGHRAGGVHAAANVDPSAEIGAGATIMAGATIDAGAKIGARSTIYPGVYVGPGAVIGEDSVIFANATIYEWVRIGDRVRIHAACVIGADGFGYAPRVVDGKPVGHQKIWHLGKVVIGDDVEIGASTCVDRGTMADTRIDRSAKLDNNCQIGHNAWIEEGAILCGMVGIAGSARIGKFAYVGGFAGIDNQVHVGDGAKVGAMSCITKDIPAGGVGVGNPQRLPREHFRAQAMLSRLGAGRGLPVKTKGGES